MPSTVVHVAIAALLAAALLESAFDLRSLGIVLAVAAFPDLDAFLGLVATGLHRAAFHTLLIPLTGAAAMAVDLHREDSWLRERGDRAVRIAWVGILVYAVAGIGPDLFSNGANLFYPIHDQFYALNGKVVLSNQRGLVQTLWEAAESTVGTTETQYYRTGVNPTRGAAPDDVERIFPIARSGLQFLLIGSAVLVTGTKLVLQRR